MKRIGERFVGEGEEEATEDCLKVRVPRHRNRMSPETNKIAHKWLKRRWGKPFEAPKNNPFYWMEHATR